MVPAFVRLPETTEDSAMINRPFRPCPERRLLDAHERHISAESARIQALASQFAFRTSRTSAKAALSPQFDPTGTAVAALIERPWR